MENELGKSIKDRPFEARVHLFKTLVQGIGLGVGGDEEYEFKRLGNLIVEYQGLGTDEEKTSLRKKGSHQCTINWGRLEKQTRRSAKQLSMLLWQK
jgi:hypothetical protein